MLFDLHNLAPAIGQVNALRKGDVARIWLYMGLRHGVNISPDEIFRFERWSANDPVSPWESQREKRIFDHTFVQNPFIHGVTPDAAGACPWE